MKKYSFVVLNLTFLLGMILAFPPHAKAKKWLIPGDIGSIQGAIAAVDPVTGAPIVNDGDTIVLLVQVYIENINFLRKAITVRSAILEDVEWLRQKQVEYLTQNPPLIILIENTINLIISDPDAVIEKTIIDGDQKGSVVTFNSGEDPNSVLSKVTVRNGCSMRGGGILCYWGSSPTISNCYIINNKAPSGGGGIGSGGGIICSSSSPIITQCIISDNLTDGRGAGIFSDHARSLTIINCEISRNSSKSNGGGINCEDGTLIIIDSEICDNTSTCGGGIFCFRSSFDIRNSLISRNFIAGTPGNGEYGSGISCYHVTSPSIIANCIITENVAGIDTSGGGIGCLGASGSFLVEIKDCIITKNQAVDSGGGIYCQASHKISNCIITENVVSGNPSSGGAGGGICCPDCSPIINKCIISKNSVISSGATLGGGIYCSSHNPSTPIISNCIINNNSSISSGIESKGGGIYCQGSSPKVINCLITRNTASVSEGYLSHGGGIYCIFHDTNFTITNCTISNNSADEGKGIQIDDPVYSPTLVNCILWDGLPEISGSIPIVVYYSNIQGGYEGVGNINIDPLFVNPDTDDYHLLPNSPSIDAGTSEGAPGEDIEDNSRPSGAGYDMGAYEYYCIPTDEICDGIDNDCDGLVDEDLGTTICGVGECQVTVQNCLKGISQVCVSENPSKEVCDGLDND